MRRLLYALLPFIFLIIHIACGNSVLSGKRVVIVIAEKNYRDEQLAIPKKVLLNNGAEVIIASTSTDVAYGMLGDSTEVDMHIKDISFDDFDGIIFVGGVGAQMLWDNASVIKLVRDFNNAGKAVGAICLAPVILTRAGIVSDIPVSSFRTTKKEIEKEGAIFSKKPVVVHENIITANGHDAAEEFSRHFVSMIMPGLPADR